jgi:hypothetical protein
MNNTHYIATNEDGQPIFIIKKAEPTDKKLLERLLTGLSEEYDTDITDVHYSHQREKIGVLVYEFTYDNTTERLELIPTWEY